MYSIHIQEVAGRLVIVGDTCLGHGIVSSGGYGLEWLRRASLGYLASKFLKRGFHDEIARCEIPDMIDVFDTDPDGAEFDQETRDSLAELLELHDNLTPDSIYEAWGSNCAASLPGFGYDPVDYATLPRRRSPLGNWCLIPRPRLTSWTRSRRRHEGSEETTKRRAAPERSTQTLRPARPPEVAASLAPGSTFQTQPMDVNDPMTTEHVLK